MPINESEISNQYETSNKFRQHKVNCGRTQNKLRSNTNLNEKKQTGIILI